MDPAGFQQLRTARGSELVQRDTAGCPGFAIAGPRGLVSKAKAAKTQAF